jgi:4-aminobutyrate aminotransferase-like enzyme/Ser/Thr protein kinase RdoA (MazF antagonist)
MIDQLPFVKRCLDTFGVSGEILPLPGEIDTNYLVTQKNSKKWVLKISPEDYDIQVLDFQEKLLEHLEKSSLKASAPMMKIAANGKKTLYLKDDTNRTRAVRMLTWIEGDLWSKVSPVTNELLFSLGQKAGQTTLALKGFDHHIASRVFDWNLDHAEWTENYIHLIDPSLQTAFSKVISQYKESKSDLEKLRKSVIHNDANDNNIITQTDFGSNIVVSIIDYGDAVKSTIINDVAVTATYAIMGQNDPLQAACAVLKGYHNSFPLEAAEVRYLYCLIGMRLVISLTKSAINKQKEPENEYLQISDQAAGRLLIQWSGIHPSLAYYSFRAAIGLMPHPHETEVNSFFKDQKIELNRMFPTENTNFISQPDMSIGSTFIGHKQEYNDAVTFWEKIKKWKKSHANTIPANGFLEVRPFYSTDAYKKEGNCGPEYRTVHLGVDYWLESGTPVHSILEGTVYSIFNNDHPKDYGPTIILLHDVNGIQFYSLYGHLSISTLSVIKQGQRVEKGTLLGYIGDHEENGDWAPHLHFQIILDMLGYQHDYPGVAYYNETEVWKSICPDPNTLFSYYTESAKKSPSTVEIQALRQKILGKNLSLSYKEPLKILKGDGAYLIDDTGRKYLDTVNNVAHVGHEHLKIVTAGSAQMAILNTNTRYLHDNILKFAESLLSTFPKELEVVYFVNSGSEANELALRMAHTFTNQRDMIALQSGYHGNTNACIEVSSYKFDGKGGRGKPKYTNLLPLPDSFRGIYRGDNTGQSYAHHAKEILQNLQQAGKSPAAFIHESIVSCGGQILLPKDFLQLVYSMVRLAGGICIADEVQTGLGRIGSHWWAFEYHDVVPDIVTIGKPLGNGHPIAAVVCTRAVADAFSNGMEYFNTFGGNPVSCAIGHEVLNIIKEEGLRENAKATGNYLIQGLQHIQQEYSMIGDIRGLGMFLGFELIDGEMNPLPQPTAYLSNRMKELGILTSTDGPDHNVIKIKPPLCFSQHHADEFLKRIHQVFKEKPMNMF